MGERPQHHLNKRKVQVTVTVHIKASHLGGGAVRLTVLTQFQVHPGAPGGSIPRRSLNSVSLVMEPLPPKGLRGVLLASPE